MDDRSKPGETMQPPVSAGFEAEELPEWARMGLPFDPDEFTIAHGRLKARLAEVGDVDVLNRLQAFDKRNNAAAVYERRIDEIRAAADGEGD